MKKKEMSVKCQTCSNELVEKTEILRKVDHECRGCRDGYPCNGAYTCSCSYRDVQSTYLICQICPPKCETCSRDIRYDETGKRICKFEKYHPTKEEMQKNMEVQEKNQKILKSQKILPTKEFHEKWKSSDVREKLELYGIKKLRILAKKKGLPFEKFRKQTLINNLILHTKNSDFPIRE